jgi:3-isopropylmalate dehydratase small subunit
MSYTGTEIYEMAIVILDELTDTGTVSDSQSKEYRYRSPRLLDMWQHEIIRNVDSYKTFEISCFRKRNLLGDLNQYGIIIENNGETQNYSASGANCFYVEVDGDCTITITENGSPVSGTYVFNDGTPTAFTGEIEITVPAGTTSFLPVKGILTASGGNVNMALSGDYYFKHTNRALSLYKYATADKVPDFKPWYKVEMPADFKNRSQVVNEYPNWQYEEDTYRKWENGKELYVNFAYEGIIRINYTPIPVKITDLAQTLEVDEVDAISGAYYLAEHFAMADQNDELAGRCRQKFAELKAESSQKTALSPQQIVDVYSIGR